MKEGGSVYIVVLGPRMRFGAADELLSFGDVARRPQIRTLARLEASVFGPGETSGAVLVSARNDAAYLQIEWYRVSCIVVCEGRIEKEECGSCGSRWDQVYACNFKHQKVYSVAKFVRRLCGLAPQLGV